MLNVLALILLVIVMLGGTGKVTKLIRSKRFGFIKGDCGRSFRFFFSDVDGYSRHTGADIVEGDTVKYIEDTEGGRTQATKVRRKRVN